MPTSELAEAIEAYHRALDAFLKGDPEPLKALYSQQDDVTNANPFGPPAVGWSDAARTLERAASNYRDGEATGFERVSGYATADLAYTIEIERYRAKVGGAADLAPIAVRVTTVFRREDDGWRVSHRHADPITTPREATSVLAQ